MYKHILVFVVALFLTSCGNEESVLKEISGKQEFCSQIHRDNNIDLDKALDSLIRLNPGKTGVMTLEEGDVSLVSRAWLCEYAQKTIDVQYFIFTADNVGLIAADYLVRAAERGVKVRILVDDICMHSTEEELLTLDAHPNIEIKIYNPTTNVGTGNVESLYNMATDFVKSNQRMHNKTLTVDGRVVITGGRNVADEYYDYDHEFNFRDRDVLLIGGKVDDVKQSFSDFWNSDISRSVATLADTVKIKTDKTDPFMALHQYACDSSNFWPQVREKIKTVPQLFNTVLGSGQLIWTDNVQFVSDVPGKNDLSKGLEGGGVTTDTLISLVKRAKKQIVIESPYLITTDKGKKLFSELTKRGVSVLIITNSMQSNDNLEAFSGYQRDRKELLETGVNIYEFKPDAAVRYKIMTGSLQKKMNFTPIFGLHAKSMVIDGEIAVIGTFNLDPRSANLNTECITIIKNFIVAQGVLQQMLEELKPENSWHTTLNYNPDKEAPIATRLKVKARRVVPKGIL
ncbi:MAG: phospholipase D family protein [Bacteroidia bacterium]